MDLHSTFKVEKKRELEVVPGSADTAHEQGNHWTFLTITSDRTLRSCEKAVKISIMIPQYQVPDPGGLDITTEYHGSGVNISHSEVHIHLVWTRLSPSSLLHVAWADQSFLLFPSHL